MLKFEQPLELSGAPGSPYTRKMLALLRYRRLQYRLLPNMRNPQVDATRYRQRPQPRVPLLPTFYGRDEAGNEQAACDSTPLIRALESSFSGRAVVPDHPALAFIDYLLEDYADEWLTKAMFHYRWTYAPDIEKAGQMLPRWGNITGSEEEIARQSEAIRQRQISRLRYVGSNEENLPTLESSFIRFVALLDKHLTQQPFLLGCRPSACDFAIYGQLTCLALFDPTPQALILQRAPRLYAWTEVLEDLSGYELKEGDWFAAEGLPETLEALLGEVGRIYAPYLLANGSAVEARAETVELELEGQRWRQQPFPYQAKCLAMIRAAYEDLVPEHRALIDGVLGRTGLVKLVT